MDNEKNPQKDFDLSKMFVRIIVTAFGKGITGFLVAAVILYVSKFIVAGFNISVVGALIGALVIGIVDMVIPGKAM